MGGGSSFYQRSWGELSYSDNSSVSDTMSIGGYSTAAQSQAGMSVGGRGGRKGKGGEQDSRYDTRYAGHDSASVSSGAPSLRTQDRTASVSASQDNSLFHGDPYASDPYYTGGGGANLGAVGGGRRGKTRADDDDMSVSLASQDLSSVSSACR
jgi:hypothetical protein